MSCWCYDCKSKVLDDRGISITTYTFIVCPECGNKRCPRATDHREVCSGSNDPGQSGSRYGTFPGPNRRLFDFIESKNNE